MSTTSRPNVVLILVDDMGFSDLGVTGSEIRTPNIDKLARNGVLMSQMYNCARCCPTRASLLTGLYPHSAGIGHMGTHLGSPEYQGYLRNDSVTIAEVLRAHGYKTLMTGKWHVAGDFEPRNMDAWCVGDVDHPGPLQRGFDHFYGIVDGATHFFSPHYLLDDHRRVTDVEDDFYFTDAITDRALGYIESAVSSTQPFFIYLAHAAPHWPLHAPPEDIERYAQTYHAGWDAIRTARHEELNALGVLERTWDISARDLDVAAWNHVKLKSWEASKMAAYAAMVDCMDQSVGRVVSKLEELGQLDDTLILFLSDNGGCAEFMAEDGWAKFYPNRTLDGRPITMGNVENLPPGDPQTFQSYDKPWANVSNAPFRLYKHYVHEGGISTPLIAHWPNGIASPSISHEPCHVVDIAPTIYNITGAPYPSEFDGHGVQPLAGENLSALFGDKPWQRAQPIYFEHEGNSAIRLGQWKLVREHDHPWELYDMRKDRTELNNLAEVYKDKTSELEALYRAWAARSGVQDWNELMPRLLEAWGLASTDG